MSSQVLSVLYEAEQFYKVSILNGARKSNEKFKAKTKSGQSERAIDLVPCAALVHFKHLGTPLVGMNF